MTYIPKGVQWYSAQIIQEIRIGDELQNVVYIKVVLLQANSPEEAYQKAVQLGKDSETSYENMDGKWITVVFHGLRNLNVILDKLVHGAELTFEEKFGLTNKELEQMILPKEQLDVFLPAPPESRPIYVPKDIAAEFDKYFGKEWTIENDLIL